MITRLCAQVFNQNKEQFIRDPNAPLALPRGLTAIT